MSINEQDDFGAIRGIVNAVWMGAILWLAIGAVAYLLTGCRTYYVYQYGLGNNEILVDAKVDKEINPSVKASLK